MKNHLLVGTRKGLVVFQKDNSQWRIIGQHFNGIPVSMVYENPFTGDWWISLDHGHWGMKLHQSSDHGSSWTEWEAPKYPEKAEVKKGIPATLKYIWAFAADKHGELWIGTEPGGLFQLNTHTKEMVLNESLWNHHSREDQWFGGGRDHPGIHSIWINPEDENHRYIGISCAGVFETKDKGQSWVPKNKGLVAEFLPNPKAEYGHDPHLLVASSKEPSIMWQQNHCGIFRSDDGGNQWIDVSQTDGKARFGFAIAIDESNPQTAWVAPAQSDEIRVPIDHKLCISRTTDGGKSWVELTDGLPQHFAYDIVYRHALISQENQVVFGTTTGNLYLSEDRGDHWKALHQNLPMIYGLHWAN